MAIIGVTGTNYIGKTEFIKDFLIKWPDYRCAKEDSIFLVNKVKEVKKSFEKEQQLELDIALEQLKAFDRKKDKVIFDGCILDILINTLWYKEKNPKKISDDFVWKIVMKVKNNFSKYDAIFYIPLSEKYPIELKDKKINLIKRNEIGNLFEGIIATYKQHLGSYFPLEDCAAVLEIYGSPKERITMADLYMDEINKIV